jgi:hypothetical protein
MNKYYSKACCLSRRKMKDFWDIYWENGSPQGEQMVQMTRLYLEGRQKELKKEISSCEVSMNAAVPYFNALARSLANFQAGNLDWGRYQRLVADLPSIASNYEKLKLELAQVEGDLSKLRD